MIAFARRSGSCPRRTRRSTNWTTLTQDCSNTGGVLWLCWFTPIVRAWRLHKDSVSDTVAGTGTECTALSFFRVLFLAWVLLLSRFRCVVSLRSAGGGVFVGTEIKGAFLFTLVRSTPQHLKMPKVKAHELRQQDKTELLKTLEELKNELSQVCLCYVHAMACLLLCCLCANFEA